MLYLSLIFPLVAYFLPIEDKRLKLLISITPAVYIMIFRFGLGTDYFSYEYLYNNHNVTSFKKAVNSQVVSMELVFRVIIYVFKSLNFTFQTFVAFMSLSIYGFIVKWIYDTDENVPLSIMLFNGMFFVVWTLGALRQGIVLAIGTYLFFNKKDKFNLWLSVLITLLLAQVHASAYIYLLLIVIKRIDFNRISLIAIITLSLISTVVPYHKLFLNMRNIRIVDKFLTYVTGNVGFWDFPGLLRLVFVVFILSFYKFFSKDKYIKTLANSSLIGFALYYVLKISEMTASRLHVFTFVLVIPLFVFLIKEFSNKKTLQILGILSLFSFSMLYLQKNLMAIQRETGLASPPLIYKMKHFNTVEYKDYYNYDNQYSVLAFNKGLCRDTRLSLNTKNPPIEHEGFRVVKGKGTRFYGVINHDGDWVIDPIYEVEPVIYGNIVELKDFQLKPYYIELNGELIVNTPYGLNSYEFIDTVIKNHKPQETSVSMETYKKDLRKYFINLDKVKDLSILEYSIPFPYKTLSMTYNNNYYYLFLNENLEVVSEKIFTGEIKFDRNNMSYAKTFCGHVVLNSHGDIIYR